VSHSNRKRTIAIYGRSNSPERNSYIQELYKQLNEHNISLHIHERFLKLTKKLLPEQAQVSTFSTHEELQRDCETFLTIGGDGTLLNSLDLVRDSGIPVMGINTGRLGFLTCVGKEQMSRGVELLLNKSYRTEQRTVLEITTQPEGIIKDYPFALNEVTLHKKDSSSMITLHVYLNGEDFNAYWADGLIIATPTGSTGYSLSCGGPILAPLAPNLVITPIAPHNLNVRPFVITHNAVLEIESDMRDKNFLISMDSRSYSCPAKTIVKLQKANFTFSLARDPDSNFMMALREKLFWGQDKRN